MFSVVPIRISVLGETHNLFFRENGENGEKEAHRYLPFVDPGSFFAVIYPSSRADVAVRAFLPGGIPRRSYASAALAAAYVLCGFLPLGREIKIEVPYGILCATAPNDNGEIGILLPKRKVLCTKTLVYASSLQQTCSVVHTERGVVRVFECNDARIYSREALARFSLGDEGEDVCATVATSRVGSRLTMLSHTVSEVENAELYSLVCAASVLAGRSPELFPVSAELSGVVFTITLYGDDLLVYSPPSFLIKL